MQLSELAKIMKGRLQGQDKALIQLHVNTDTRQLKSGELFFALKGEQFDGHDFLAQVGEQKALAAVVSQPVTAEIPLIMVNDTLQALTDLAVYHREQFSCPIIAVTGSCGKTTTKMLLANVFGEAGSVLSNPASFNNAIGVPLTLLQLNATHQYAISELGANHLGEIGILSSLVKPQVAIITNAGNAHLAGFGDIEGVARTKGDIFLGLKKEGIAVINADDSFSDYWKKLVNQYQIITFGLTPLADIRAKNISLDHRGCPQFQLITPKGQCEISLPLMGKHNIYNALAAAAAAYALNLDLLMIRQGLENAKAVTKRLVEYVGVGDAIIIDDSYNANPDSMLAAIQLLTARAEQTILVMGDMLELGHETEKFHHEVGLQAKQYGVSRLFCYGKLSKLAAQAFGEQALSFDEQADLIEILKTYLKKEVIVLVKGSRSMKMENVVAAIKSESM